MGTPFLNAQSRHSSIIVVKVHFRLYTDKIFFIRDSIRVSKIILFAIGCLRKNIIVDYGEEHKNSYCFSFLFPYIFSIISFRAYLFSKSIKYR